MSPGAVETLAGSNNVKYRLVYDEAVDWEEAAEG
jgi:hypothetical protein